MKKRIAKYPIVTVNEFKKILLEAIADGKKNMTIPEVIEWYMEQGFPKFDIQNVNSMLKAMQGDIYFLNPMLVDFGDSMFYWMVCGMDAILVKKPNA